MSECKVMCIQRELDCFLLTHLYTVETNYTFDTLLHISIQCDLNMWVRFVTLINWMCFVTPKLLISNEKLPNSTVAYSSSSSIGTTARYEPWPVEQCPSICFCLSLSLSIFSLPALQDLLLLALSIFFWVFLSVSSLPVVGWRSFWASCLLPFSPGALANLSFAPLSNRPHAVVGILHHVACRHSATAVTAQGNLEWKKNQPLVGNKYIASPSTEL